MDDSHVWTVSHEGGGFTRVTADAWVIGPNGDLGFHNGSPQNPFFIRAFAAGRGPR